MKSAHALLLCLLFAGVFRPLITEAQPVTQIAGGYGHTLLTKSDGSLWVMGFNNYGQLGDGGVAATNRPERIVATNVTAIAAGELDSFFVTNGALWAMGYDGFGELGNGSSISTIRPVLIVPGNVTAVAAGQQHTLFVEQNGSLWGMGYNYNGQLGDGTTDNGNYYTNLPEQIEPGNVTAVAAGNGHSLFLKSNGSLWAMGYDYYGELGDGIFNTNANAPDGTNQPEEIVASNVTAIAAGEFHSLFLKSNGSLWGMGWNEFGQLGDGTTNNVNRPEMIYPSNVVAIAAGEGHSLFIKSDGSLWGMGDDYYGQLGDGIFATNSPYGTNQPEEIAPNNVTAISAGYLSSYFIESGGSLWAVGSDVYGELGDGVTYPTYNALNGTNVVEQVLGAYNEIYGFRLNNGAMQLSFEGLAGTNYALDRCFNLLPPNWIPQATNPASSFGALVFTNTPGAGTNNFWRIRLVR